MLAHTSLTKLDIWASVSICKRETQTHFSSPAGHFYNTYFQLLNLLGEVPQTQGAIPGARQSKLAVWGDDNITYKVRVAPQGALGDAVVGLITGQFPHDNGLVWKVEQNNDLRPFLNQETTVWLH